MSGTGWRRLHAVMTLVWIGLILPTVLWWHSSILWVGLMSVYACITGHLSSWQAARAEVKAEEAQR